MGNKNRSHRLSVSYSVCPLYDDTLNFYLYVSASLFLFVSLTLLYIRMFYKALFTYVVDTYTINVNLL